MQSTDCADHRTRTVHAGTGIHITRQNSKQMSSAEVTSENNFLNQGTADGVGL